MITKYTEYIVEKVDKKLKINSVRDIISIEDFKILITNKNYFKIKNILLDFLHNNTLKDKPINHITSFLNNFSKDEIANILTPLYDLYNDNNNISEFMKMLLYNQVDIYIIINYYNKLNDNNKKLFYWSIVSSYDFEYKFEIFKTIYKEHFESNNLNNLYDIEYTFKYLINAFYTDKTKNKNEIKDILTEILNNKIVDVATYNFYKTFQYIKSVEILDLFLEKIEKEYNNFLHKKQYDYLFDNLIKSKNYDLVLYAYNKFSEKVHELCKYNRRTLIYNLKDGFNDEFVNKIIKLFLKDTKLTFGQFLNTNLIEIQKEFNNNLNLKDENIIDDLFQHLDSSKTKEQNFVSIKVMFNKLHYNHYMKILEYLKKYDYYNDYILLILIFFIKHKEFCYRNIEYSNFVKNELFKINIYNNIYQEQFTNGLFDIRKKLFSNTRQYYYTYSNASVIIKQICEYTADNILSHNHSLIYFDMYKKWLYSPEIKNKYDYLFNAQNFDLI